MCVVTTLDVWSRWMHPLSCPEPNNLRKRKEKKNAFRRVHILYPAHI